LLVEVGLAVILSMQEVSGSIVVRGNCRETVGVNGTAELAVPITIELICCPGANVADDSALADEDRELTVLDDVIAVEDDLVVEDVRRIVPDAPPVVAVVVDFPAEINNRVDSVNGTRAGKSAVVLTNRTTYRILCGD
jgi:hypothetical protein